MGSGIFALSTRAMFANQAMLDTTAHNISNVNTPGYSRQKVELSTEGGMYTGAGFSAGASRSPPSPARPTSS